MLSIDHIATQVSASPIMAGIGGLVALVIFCVALGFHGDLNRIISSAATVAMPIAGAAIVVFAYGTVKVHGFAWSTTFCLAYFTILMIILRSLYRERNTPTPCQAP